MSTEQARQLGFTHRASMFGIPCYWNDNDSVMAGTNWLYDLLISKCSPMLQWCFARLYYMRNGEACDGFPIEIVDEL